MTTRPYELLARFASDGTIAGVHVRTITTVDGRDFESDPLPLASTNDPAFQSFVAQFSASVVAERDALRTQIDAANARIAQLLEAVPFNPRIIDATAFYERLTKDEILTLFSSSDATTKTIAETILAYKTNDWPVVFESPEFQQMLSYLLQSETLTESRMTELTRDATRAEAYDAD